MRAALRKNQEKLDAWKSLLKEEVPAEESQETAAVETEVQPTEHTQPIEREKNGAENVIEENQKEEIEESGTPIVGENTEEEKQPTEPTPIGTNKWGNVYQWAKGKAREAVDFLKGLQSGYLKGVFHRDDIGDIDLVWGNEKAGLKHIIEKHLKEQNDFDNENEMISSIDNVIKNGTIREEDNSIIIEHGNNRVVVAKDENSGNYVVTAYDYVRGAEEKKNENSATTFTAGQTSKEEEARAVASNNHSQDKDTNNTQNEQAQSAQTGDEVVRTSLLESVEERKRAKASELSEQGISDARLLDLLDEQAVAEDAYLRALDKYGIKHTTRLTGNVTGNRFMSSVVNAVKKLTTEEAREVLSAALQYKKSALKYKLREAMNTHLSTIRESKKYEDRKEDADVAFDKVSSANDEFLDLLFENGLYDYESLAVSRMLPKGTEEQDALSGAFAEAYPEMSKRIRAAQDALTDYNRNIKSSQVSNKATAERAVQTKEKTQKPRKKVYIRNRSGAMVEAWVSESEDFTESGKQISVYRNATGEEKYSRRTRSGIYDEEGVSYQDKMVENTSTLEERTHRVKNTITASSSARSIVRQIAVMMDEKMDNGVLLNLKNNLVSLAKLINGLQHIDHRVKRAMLEVIDALDIETYEQVLNGDVESKPIDKNSVTYAISQIRTQRKSRETVDALIDSNKQWLETIRNRVEIVAETLEETEANPYFSVQDEDIDMFRRKKKVETEQKQDKKKGLETLSDFVRAFNLNGRIKVLFEADELREASTEAYNAVMSGENVYGFYNKKNHQLYIYAPNISTNEDLLSTLYHESIAHFGLRELLTEEEFNELLDKTWEMMSYEERKRHLSEFGVNYNPMIAVDERMRRKSAEEYLASTAESERFLDYLTERNEQEAKTWIVKKWKKVCDFLRGAFKKYTGKELSSKDEMVLDALYRSAHLLGSDTYARFNYYRNLVREMGADGVEMGNVGEDMFRRGEKNISKQEYELLRQGVMMNNSLYGKNKPIETTFTSDNFYIYNNYGYDSFSVIKSIPIEGNERLIRHLYNILENETYGNTRSIASIIDDVISREKQYSSSDATTKRQRGEDATVSNMDLRHQTERGADNEKSNTDVGDGRGAIMYRRGKPAEYVNLSNLFKPKGTLTSSALAKEQALVGAYMQWMKGLLGAGRLVTNNLQSASVYAQA